MKKILTIITATAILATSSFSASAEETGIINLNKDSMCFLFTKENLDKTIFTEEMKKFYKWASANKSDQAILYGITKGTAEGTAIGMKQIYGDLSIDFLKNMGMGTNTKLTWENLIWNFYQFNLSILSDENKDSASLLTFMNSVYNEQHRAEKNENIEKELSDRYNTIFFINSVEELNFQTFFSYTELNNKRFNQLFKYVALKDYKKAYEYMIEENENDKTAYAVEALIQGCNSSETKTVRDVIIFKKTESQASDSDSVEQEIIKDKNGYVDYLYLHFKKDKTEELTKDYVKGFLETYKERMMNNCLNEVVYDDKLSINMKVVMIDENKKEYGRFEINKKTCEIWKAEKK